jgi:hypothetical protein
VAVVGANTSGRFNKTLVRVKANLAALSRIFHNQDALLVTQGHITIYYLFVSKLRPTDQSVARDFLEAFERRRRNNRNRGSNHGDRALDEFDLASRSTNDKGSLETRLRIVRAKFVTWKRNGTV